MNAYRAANGLPALRRDGCLDGIAAVYAAVVLQNDQHLASSTVHSLDGEPWDRTTRAGYAWAAFSENIGQTSYLGMTPTAADAARAMGSMWLNSAAHRENMLAGDISDVGMGCASGAPSIAPRSGWTPQLVLICVADFGGPW